MRKLQKSLDNSSHQQRVENNPQFLDKQSEKKRVNLESSDCREFMREYEEHKNKPFLPVISLLCLQSKSCVKKQFFELSALQCTRQQLIEVATDKILQNQFCSRELNRKIVWQLITKIALGYNSISYHNFSHGFTLMQIFLKTFHVDQKLSSFVSSEELVLYLFAALTHDINHRGTNNDFQIKMKTKLAEQAENCAVLERMHAKTFFDIIKFNPHLNILAMTSNSHKSKQIVLNAILSTDMAQHFKKMSKLQQLNENKNDKESKNLLLQSLFHACDLGNGTFSFQTFINWSVLLAHQFQEQTLLEKQMKVEVTKHFKFKNMKDFYSGQYLFLDKFVIPLWKELTSHFVDLSSLIEQLQKNREKVKEIGDNIQ